MMIAILDTYLLSTLVIAAMVGSIYLAGRMAQRRGRNFRNWAWIAGMLIGPLALLVLLLLPKLDDSDGEHA
jgi:MFS family permease